MRTLSGSKVKVTWNYSEEKIKSLTGRVRDLIMLSENNFYLVVSKDGKDFFIPIDRIALMEIMDVNEIESEDKNLDLYR